jgi:tetratricopeptide (TPR) repeat protein
VQDERTLDLPAADVVTEIAAPATTIGHFQILREVGAGGMGVVYEAYDPDLDRKVAVKVVRDFQPGSPAGRRLIDEAQAMARLAHPNVVAVYEVGTIVDQVFVVMELVPGDTLAAWLAKPRHWRDIVRALAQAGDGLVAAHAAGLVHGDFKPHNVLVDDSGRVRVADFGLARVMGDRFPKLAAGSRGPGDRRPAGSPAERSEAGGPGDRRPAGSPAERSEAGGVAGTPGYMAPEQLAGEPYDARADQYAFAVALRQAVQGQRIPRRIQRALDRALSPEPAARFPEMRALLVEMRASVRSHRATIGAALGIAAVSAAVATGVTWSTASERDDCLDGAALVDDVWTTAAREHAATGGGATAPLVDDWAAQWRLARRAACTTDHEARPARLACLDGRLAELRAQVGVWQRGDRDILARAFSAAASLPSPASCTLSAPPPPTGMLAAPAIDRIANVMALARAGRSKEARPKIAAMLGEAEATGDPVTYGSALYTAALVERDLALFAEATDHFAKAAREATRANVPGKAIDAMMMQAELASDRGEPQRALGILDAAQALATGPQTDARASQLLLARGDALMMIGKLPEAADVDRRAIALLEPLAQREHANRIKLAAAYGALAGAEQHMLHYKESQALLMRALAIEEVDYGPNHPELAKTIHDLANTEMRLRDFASAQAHYERARAILVAAYGEHHELVGLTDYSLGGMELQRNQNAAARKYFERALAVLLAAVGPDHPDVAQVEGALGYLDRDADHCRDGIPRFEHAIAIIERAGHGGTELAAHLTNLGACLADVGRDAEARPILERSLAEQAKVGVPEVERSEAYALLAEIAWRAGQKAKAITLAKQVIALTAGLDEPAAGLHSYMEKQLAGWLRSR